MSNAIGFVSDLHVLSRYGLVPPEWRHESDPLAEMQRYLWQCWQHFIDAIPPLDALVVIGDVIEGTLQLRGVPRDHVSDDASDQIDAAEATLGPLVRKARSVYLVHGTPFHDGGGDRMEAIGERLDTVRWAGRRRAGQVLDLAWNGIVVNCSHHNTRGWMWLGGAGSRISVLAAASEAVGKAPRADVIVRGDLHTSLKVETLGKWVCFLPGWTMPGPYAIRRMEATRAYLATDIGGAVMTYGENGIGWHADLTYPLFQRRIVNSEEPYGETEAATPDARQTRRGAAGRASRAARGGRGRRRRDGH